MTGEQKLPGSDEHSISFRVTIESVVLGATVFGFSLTLARLATLHYFGAKFIGIFEFGGLLFGMLGQITIGALLSVLVSLTRSTLVRLLLMLFTTAVVFANIAAFHYEAVFGRLPSASLIYYLNETGQLFSSVNANSPWGLILFEIVVILIGLSFVWFYWPFRRGSRPVKSSNVKWFVLGLSVCCFITVSTHIKPSLLPERMFWGSRVPLIWLAQSGLLEKAYPSTKTTLAKDDIWRFQQKMGHRIPFGGFDARYPLCREETQSKRGQGNGRSLILLILESVGVSELFADRNGEPVMPSLRRIAQHTLLFENFLATGTKSCQAMPSIFAGLPAQPVKNLLWRSPLNNMDGFPRYLLNQGYRTAYFHGSDLSFEQQRDFLKMVGFEELHEQDPTSPTPSYAWGYSDREMFRRLRAWIDENSSVTAGQPYFACLFTLSTHDPYVLPSDWKPRFSTNAPSYDFPGDWGNIRIYSGRKAAFFDSLRFLDKQIRVFHDWYLRVEKPKGTVLAIVGDHTPLIRDSSAAEQESAIRFDVPLIIEGLGIDPERCPSCKQRLGSQTDVPATLGKLLDIEPGRCDQGIDLLQPDSTWPSERWILTLAGDELELQYAWSPDVVTILNRITRQIHVAAHRPRLSSTAIKRGIEQANQFYRLSNQTSSYLISNDSLSPPMNDHETLRKPLPSVKTPIFVSHRGNSDGPLPEEQQNRISAIDRAIAAGFEWVEIDIQITRDGRLVLSHDPTFKTDDGQERRIDTFTLDELKKHESMRDTAVLDHVFSDYGNRVNLLVELKRQQHAAKMLSLAHGMARLINTHRGNKKVIVDSFSRFLVNAVRSHSDCMVGIDSPYKRPLTPSEFKSYRLAGIDWVYLHKDVVNPTVIRAAHSWGLRVMVYTVNDIEVLKKLRKELPDGIITDRSGLIEEFSRIID